MKKEITETMREKLRAPFPDQAYDYLKHKPEFTTLKAMYITERLNDVFGIGRWTIEFNIVEKTADNIVLQGEFIAFDYDMHVPKTFGGHALNRKGMELADAYKAALTDCQSKIASYLEIGIDMFKGKIKTKEQEKALKDKYGTNYQNNNQQRKQLQKQPIKNVKHIQKEIDEIKEGKIIKMQKREKEILTDKHKNYNDCVNYLAGGGSILEIKKRFEVSNLVEKGLSNAAADIVFLQWQREQKQI